MKSGTHFRFKQFSVAHDKTSHKVGTDGVLLGAWADVSNAKEILEIGTGSGVISLIVAQRSDEETKIEAVEIEKDAVDQAKENVKNSPWPEKIVVHHSSIQEFEPQKKYDLIISNPPFFIDSWLPPESKRSQARHTHTLTFPELINHSLRLLNSEGKLAVILPYQEALRFIGEAMRKNLFCVRRLNVQSRAHKPVERVLLEFWQKQIPVHESSLVIHGNSNEWSEDYMTLTGEFYLKM